jgi:hypothetical protein
VWGDNGPSKRATRYLSAAATIMNARHKSAGFAAVWSHDVAQSLDMRCARLAC